MKIGIIVAMDKELAQLRDLLSSPQDSRKGILPCTIGQIGHHEVVLQKCGIGKVNATIGTTELAIHHHPELIISTGCAGGADTNLHITDVVVGSHYTYHDLYCGSEVAYGQLKDLPPFFTADTSLVEKALSLHCSTPVHSGLMVSGDWFVDSREKMREILGHFPDAKAVDMESCAIAQACYLYGIPFVSFRVISDVPLSDEKASQYFDFWGRLADGSFEVTRQFIEAI